MGTANKVPGVSGGIVAFVAGFYEEFIYSLQKFNRKGLMLLFTGRFTAFFNYVNGRFLSLLFLGMIISYFSVSKVLDYLIFDNYVQLFYRIQNQDQLLYHRLHCFVLNLFFLINLL